MLRVLVILALVVFALVYLSRRLAPLWTAVREIRRQVERAAGGSATAARGRGTPGGARGETAEGRLVACRRCGVYVAEDRALAGAGGADVYCSSECAAAGPGADDEVAGA